MDFGTKSTSQNGLLTTESRVQYINKTYLKYVCLILIDQFLSCTEVCEESQNKGKTYPTMQLNSCLVKRIKFSTINCYDIKLKE